MMGEMNDEVEASNEMSNKVERVMK